MTNTTPTLRQYTYTDYPHLIPLYQEFGQYYRQIDPLHLTTVSPNYGEYYLSQDLVELYSHQGLFLIAEQQKQIIAFGLAIVKHPSEYDEYQPQKTGYIWELFVTTAHRRQGLGTQLINQLHQYLTDQQCQTIRLQAFASNQSAISFYHKYGYQPREYTLIKKM